MKVTGKLAARIKENKPSLWIQRELSEIKFKRVTVGTGCPRWCDRESRRHVSQQNMGHCKLLPTVDT